MSLGCWAGRKVVATASVSGSSLREVQIIGGHDIIKNCNTILKNCRLQNSDLSMSVTPMRLELPKFFKRMVQQNIVTIDSSNYMDYINLLWYLYCGIPNKSLSTQQRTCACNSCSYNQYLNTSQTSKQLLRHS